MERIKILDTCIDNLSMVEAVKCVDSYVSQKKTLHLVGVNADKMNEFHKNEQLKAIVDECEIVHAHGVSVVWASRILKQPVKERVAGIDLMNCLLELAEQKQYSVYLLGAKQEIVEKTAAKILEKHPKLKLAGYRNGYFLKEEWHEVAEEIRASHADLVFVGISSPLKEYLVEYLQKTEKIGGVFMGVGGSFDVISGEIPRAPLWMQKSGMEWFFRFMQEPKRLGGRYFYGNLFFIYRVFCEKLKSRQGKRI